MHPPPPHTHFKLPCGVLSPRLAALFWEVKSNLRKWVTLSVLLSFTYCPKSLLPLLPVPP